MKAVVDFVRQQFEEAEAFIPLHVPVFIGNEKAYLNECIDSTFVSSVGKFVDQFEEKMCALTGAAHATAVVNGTSGIHIALHVLEVGQEDLVITQPLTFVATCNAIAYTGAEPVFVDVDMDTMGLSPEALETFLEEQCEMVDGNCQHRATGKTIKACVPMHTFGFPCRIEEIVTVCQQWNITVVEDAAESLGSYVGAQHTGTFGRLGVFSFNGNKIATAGGGGCVVTQDEALGKRIKHLTTTAKQPHRWAYRHEEVGFNYRMPNVNAALALAQLESLPQFMENKRALAESYRQFFEGQPYGFKWEREGTTANFWLNTVLLRDAEEKEAFLEATNSAKVVTRPIWDLMNSLPQYENSLRGDLTVAADLASRVVNIPSSVRLKPA
jgi:aminotransferase in exopolysaccharide biosynthesis